MFLCKLHHRGFPSSGTPLESSNHQSSLMNLLKVTKRVLNCNCYNGTTNISLEIKYQILPYPNETLFETCQLYTHIYIYIYCAWDFRAKSSRVITYEEFQKALEELALKRFKGQSKEEALQAIHKLIEGKEPTNVGVTVRPLICIKFLHTCI